MSGFHFGKANDQVKVARLVPSIPNLKLDTKCKGRFYRELRKFIRSGNSGCSKIVRRFAEQNDF